tara:strand:+ start:2333 stop:2827 length:495 start_codon:yes stop_codon:yes gene_type:complete
MANIFKNIKSNFLNYIPILFLFGIALDGSSTINIKFISINLHYILVYYWALRKPEFFGYGYIFLAGIISDVVFGLPLGINALSLLSIAGIAAYVKLVTVRVRLINDWMSFIPALLVANFIYFLSLHFSNISVDYLYLIQNSFFTFITYPILWIIFSMLLKIIKN